MKNTLFNIMTLAATVFVATYAHLANASDDDHPLLGRYPGAQNINHPRSVEYDVVELPAGPMTDDGPERTIELEGRIRWDAYVGPLDTSEIAVGRSYEAALDEADFEMLFSCAGEECGDLTPFLANRSFADMGEPIRGVSSGWGWKHYVRYNDRVRFYLAKRETEENLVHALIYISRYAPRDTHMFIGHIIVESAPLEIKKIKTEVLEADELSDGLEEAGHVIVPGILFEYDSAEIRPESAEALEQMALFLKEYPELEILVVGHTDNQGSLEYNLNLSEQRAKAVRQELIKDYGIEGARMIPFGAGFAAPIASNRTENGQTENRRVEIVLME